MRFIRKTAVAAGVTGLAIAGSIAGFSAAQASTPPRPVPTVTTTLPSEDPTFPSHFPPTFPSHFPPRFCNPNWGTFPKQFGGSSRAELDSVDTAQSNCYDRVVFHYNGHGRGYNVRYANRVFSEGRGTDLVPYTGGNAYLAVTLRDPADESAADFNSGPGQHLANVLGYRQLRDVVYGGSFEGRTTFVLGLRQHRPFRVSELVGRSGDNELAVDVAR